MGDYVPEWFAGHANGSRASAARILPLVLDAVRIESAVDAGCGVGAWLNVLGQLGIHDVVGIDGDYVDLKQIEIPVERFVVADLAHGFDLGRGFDLAVSLEVAEHLPAPSAEVFVESLVRHAQVVLFSAAIPGQGGNGHVNEQWPDYWASRFREHGYLAVDAIRPQVWIDPLVEPYYAQNALLYIHERALPQEFLACVVTELERLRIVHPRQFAKFRPPPPSKTRVFLESAIGAAATDRLRKRLGRT
jgi:SAM-dependent methyltransferase